MRSLAPLLRLIRLVGAGFAASCLICLPPVHAVGDGTPIGAKALKETGEFGWLVRLVDETGKTVCTGTLVDPEWVLTAAHCFTLKARPPVAAAVGGGSAVPIVQVEQHPIFGRRPGTFAFDAAMVKLETPSEVNAIALAPQTGDGLAEGDPLLVAGWGLDATGTLPTVPSAGMMRFRGKNSPSFMGAVPDPAFACNGDSGGPLLHLANGSPVQVGVLSFGFSTTCDASVIATRVESIANWAQELTLNVVVAPLVAREPAKGRLKVDVPVRLNRPSPFPVEITVESEGDTATPGVDYEAKDGKIKLKAGETEGTYTFTVLADDVEEKNFERFHLRVRADRAQVPVPKVPMIIAGTQNQPPVAYSSTTTTLANRSVPIELAGFDPDHGPLPLALASITSPNGTVFDCKPTCRFLATNGFVGTAIVTFVVTDGQDSATGTVTIDVQPPNNFPLVQDGVIEGKSGSDFSFLVEVIDELPAWELNFGIEVLAGTNGPLPPACQVEDATHLRCFVDLTDARPDVGDNIMADVTVTDPGGLSRTGRWFITVVAP